MSNKVRMRNNNDGTSYSNSAMMSNKANDMQQG